MDRPTQDYSAARVMRHIGVGRLVAIAISALALMLILVLPADSMTRLWIIIAAEVISLAVFLLSAARMPAGIRLVWWLLSAFLALTVAGDLVYDVLLYGFGTSPFPSWADLFYLTSYLPEIAALIILVRMRKRVWDSQAWIDASVITLAALTLTTTLVVLPMLEQSVLSDFGSYLALLYPLLDLVVLTVLIRLTVAGGRPSWSLVLLVAAVSVVMTADLLYNGIAANVTIEDSPPWLDVLYAGAILLMAFAATAPGAASIGNPSPKRPPMMSAGRTVALGVGTLTAPLLLAVMAILDRSPPVVFLAVATIVINVLVLWRVLLLVGTIRNQSDRLDRMARTDALTGLPNRRSWDFALARAEEAATRTGDALTVAIADIDHFKRYNDRFGHVAGDELLAECAHAWRGSLDPSLFLARYGGEEFAALLPGLSPGAVESALEGLRRATPARVTVSIGCSIREPGRPVAEAVQRADEALYAAKEAGRDRLVVASRHIDEHGVAKTA